MSARTVKNIAVNVNLSSPMIHMKFPNVFPIALPITKKINILDWSSLQRDAMASLGKVSVRLSVCRTRAVGSLLLSRIVPSFNRTRLPHSDEILPQHGHELWCGTEISVSMLLGNNTRLDYHCYDVP